MVFHWSDSKSHQVSKTLLRILAVFSNVVVWIVSTHPPTCKSSRLFNNPLVIVPNAPITIGTIVTFMFHSFFNSIARSRYLFFFWLFFRFILWSTGTVKSTILQILFFVDYYKVWSSGQDYFIIIILAFHISDSRWFFTEIWVTASLLKSPGLFSVFWQFSTMLSFGWSPLVRQPPSPLFPLVIPYLLFQTHQLQLL